MADQVETNAVDIPKGSALKIQQIIDAYMENIEELLYKEYSGKKTISKYFGLGRVQNSPLHEQLYEDLKMETDFLVRRLEAEPDADEALSAVRSLIAYGRRDFADVEESIRLILIAIEGLAIPLLPFIEKEEIEKLCSEYAARYPKREMLPKQKELYDTMRALLGEPVKKKKGLKGIFKNG